MKVTSPFLVSSLLEVRLEADFHVRESRTPTRPRSPGSHHSGGIARATAPRPLKNITDSGGTVSDSE